MPNPPVETEETSVTAVPARTKDCTTVVYCLVDT